MASLFSSPPKPPKPIKPDPAPNLAEKAIQEAAADAARRRQSARGFRSTILSNLVQSSGGGLKTTLGS